MNVWLEPNPNGTHLCVRNGIPNTGSYTWELTTEERNQLRQACTSNSCTVRYGIYTIIGGTTYSSYVDKTMTRSNLSLISREYFKTMDQKMEGKAPVWYIGAFAEYGVVTAKDTYNPLLIGARLTVLLPLPTRHVCNCLPDQRFSKKHR